MKLRWALAALALLSTTQPARAADPDWVWRTLETAHFRIHYYVGENRLAQRVAVLAEDAHTRLVPILDHAPKGKTEIVLTDDTDDSNGSATVYLYPVMRLYATAPDDRSELNDYDDWLSALILHEYTHILHLDTIHGVARVINWILGWGERSRIYSPNQAQPRFIIEGLAVLEETERSSGGRLRSTIFDMYMRCASLEGKFQRLDQITGSPIQWPRGASAYVYGSAFLRYIAGRFGVDSLRRLSHDYGGVWIPWSINRSLKRVVGKTFTELYPDFRASMAERYRAQQAAIAGAAITASRVLTEPRESAVRPVFTPDGKEVIWADSDGYSRQRFRRLSVEPEAVSKRTGRPALRTVFVVDAAGSSSLSRDGQRLYFNAFEVWRTTYSYNDLFVYDAVRREKRRLTEGWRAEAPDLSPDGKTLAFTINEAGARSLVTMPVGAPDAALETSGDRRRRSVAPIHRLVGNLDDLSQIYTPTWSPDGRRIAFSWWRDRGHRDIWIVDVETRALERVTADRALDLEPRWSPDGKYLYFSSDRGGVYNLYAWEVATRQLSQVTNVVGGAFDVAISPDGGRAVYVGFQADGWRLELIDLEPTRWRPAPPRPASDGDAAVSADQVIAPLRPELARTDTPRPPAARLPDEPSPPLPTRRYQPWRSAWPRSWLLSSYPDAFGQVLALQLSGSDVVGNHQWALSIGFSLARVDGVSFSTSYTYTGSFPSFSVSASRNLVRRGGFFVDGIERPYVEDDYALRARLGLPLLRRVDQSSELSFGYSLVYLRDNGDVKVPLDPNLITPRRPETGQFSSLSMGWTWSNVHRFTYSIGAGWGRSLAFSMSASLRAIGSRFNVVTASWRWTEHVPLWWRSHVLTVAYSGGIAGGDLTNRSVFFLGGYAPQPDLLRAVVDLSRPGTASLRGYPNSSVAGDQFHVANFEYRFPLAWIERGYSTNPLYLRRLHGAVFADVGNAFSGGFDPLAVKVGIGTELRLEVLLGYYLPASFQLGYAHGFMKGGEDQVYFLLNNPF